MGNLRYRAFLSYAHADVDWARRLHARLEGFRIDKDLAGRITPLGPVPDRLAPIFRDREDFSGGHTLTDATLAALDASAALIVLCSTVSATRPAVNEEVRLFRARHPDRPAIPVILDGDYPDNFPPALLFELTEDGAVDKSRPITILGPDVREDRGDGPRLALAKIVAGLTGVPPIEIDNRIKRQQRRRTWAISLAAAAALALSAGGGWFYWLSDQRGQVIVSQQQREQEAIQLARNLLKDRAGQAGAPGQEQDLIAAIRQLGRDADAGDAIAARVLDLLRQGKVSEAVEVRVAAAEAAERRAAVEKTKAAQNYREAAALAAVADPAKARELYAKAVRLDPANIEGLSRHGWFQQEAGNLTEAETTYRKVIALGQRGTDDHWIYWARLGLGDIQVERGDLGVAKDTYWAAASMADRLAKADPDNPGWQRNLSVSYDKVGDVLVAQGNLTDALNSFRHSLAIADRLAKADPNNADWQRDLSVSYHKVGGVLVAQGNLTDALNSFRHSLAIHDRLAKADPNSAGGQRDLSVSYDKVGDVLVAQGDLTGALSSFRDSLAIADRLAKADPDNAVWQRDLSVSYNKVGDVLVAQGNLTDSLSSFRDSLAIRDRLAKADPNNAAWQRDLSVSYSKVGDVLVAQGNLTDALNSFRDGLAMADRLAKADSSNVGWQRDLAIVHERVGNTALRLKDMDTARTAFTNALAVYTLLIERNPGDTRSRLLSVVPHWRLSRLDKANGVAHLQEALAILRPLAAANRLDANRIKWIGQMEAELAEMER